MHIRESRHSATLCNTLHHTATHCNSLQHSTTHCNKLQHTATNCNTLQHTATHCNKLQHTATHCNTLQHSAVCGSAVCRRLSSGCCTHAAKLAMNLPCWTHASLHMHAFVTWWYVWVCDPLMCMSNESCLLSQYMYSYICMRSWIVYMFEVGTLKKSRTTSWLWRRSGL